MLLRVAAVVSFDKCAYDFGPLSSGMRRSTVSTAGAKPGVAARTGLARALTLRALRRRARKSRISMREARDEPGVAERTGSARALTFRGLRRRARKSRISMRGIFM